MNKRLAIVPARGGSTRIPNKNIVDFCGKPLIIYSLEAARESRLFDTIHVSTDSEKIINLITKNGFSADFQRPARLSTNNVSITSVLRWVVGEYDKKNTVFDEVCLLMATAPLITREDLLEAHSIFSARKMCLPLLSVAQFPAPIERAMRINEKEILCFNEPSHKTAHSQHLSKTYFDAGAFAFFTRDQLADSNESVYSDYIPYVLPKYKAVDINDPEDLHLAKRLYLGMQRTTP